MRRARLISTSRSRRPGCAGPRTGQCVGLGDGDLIQQRGPLFPSFEPVPRGVLAVLCRPLAVARRPPSCACRPPAIGRRTFRDPFRVAFVHFPVALGGRLVAGLGRLIARRGTRVPDGHSSCPFVSPAQTLGGAVVATLRGGVMDAAIATVDKVTVAGRLIPIGGGLVGVGGNLIGGGGGLVGVGSGLIALGRRLVARTRRLVVVGQRSVVLGIERWIEHFGDRPNICDL